MSTSGKILGVHVDDNISWNDHFHHVSKKVLSYMWLLSKIKTYLSNEHRLLYYNSYIKPHFGYCSVVWSNSSNFNVTAKAGMQINLISGLQKFKRIS